MGRKPKTSSTPSFFKVLINEDYTTRLRLPHVFVEKYREFLPESAKLRTSSGATWDVKLEEETYDDDDDDEDEKHWCFTGEWSKFAKDLELKLGEFLVFWFNIGDSTFDVSVYGTHCCEREIPAKNNLLAMDTDEDFDLSNDCQNAPDSSKKRRRNFVPEREVSGNSGKEAHPRFEVVLTEHRKSRWCLPKKFVEAARLIGKRAVVLEFPPKQRFWAVALDQSARPNSTLDVSVGWNDFRKENKLVLGRTYSFEFDPARNVIRVKEHKERKTVG